MDSPNWLVFQRYEAGRPVAFAELLWLGDALIERQGNIKTYGSSEMTNQADSRALAATIDAKGQALEAASFQLVREWTFDPATFDFVLLQAEIESAARAAVTEVKAHHPGANAFALCTDQAAMTISPIAHAFDSIADAPNDTLFIPDEWSIWKGDAHFDIAYGLILSQHRDDLTRFDPDDFQRGFTRAAVNALLRLDAEGVFGPINERILMVHITDSDQDEDAMLRLNGPELFQRWKAWV